MPYLTWNLQNLGAVWVQCTPQFDHLEMDLGLTKSNEGLLGELWEWAGSIVGNLPMVLDSTFGTPLDSTFRIELESTFGIPLLGVCFTVSCLKFKILSLLKLLVHTLWCSWLT